MLLYIILLSVCTTIFGQSLNDTNAGLTTIEVITKYGYPSESHDVITADDYVVRIHRIPYGLSGNTSGKGVPVLLMPGLFCTSAQWVNIGPDKSLGYLLADAGFDVWMGNERSSVYSRKNLNIDPDTNPAEFFDYSVHEIAIYDGSAIIDYILNATAQTQILFVGHSQGSTVAFILGAEQPEYNDKIRLAIGLSPIAYLKNSKNLIIEYIAANYDAFINITVVSNIHELFSYKQAFQELKIAICSTGSPLQFLCTFALFSMGGNDSAQLDIDTLSTIFTAIPGACSVREYFHWMQIINSDCFCQYDYGPEQNLIEYGQMTPPNYDISKITMPIILHYANNDLISDPIDVEHFTSQLPNLIAAKLISYNDFTHFDFLYGIDVVPLVYNDVINELLSAV